MIATNHILHIAPPCAVQATRKLLLERAGYRVEWARTIRQGRELLAVRAFPVVIFGVLLRTKDVEQLAATIRQRSPETRLISSGAPFLRRVVDAYLEPQGGAGRFLCEVGRLLMQAHGHPEVAGAHLMYVDAERRYIAVTDEACMLLGYRREELLGKNIDDVTYPATADVPKQFEQYRHQGAQAGTFILQHRDGSPIPVRFAAEVLPDGCMVSHLTPLAGVQLGPSQ